MSYSIVHPIQAEWLKSLIGKNIVMPPVQREDLVIGNIYSDLCDTCQYASFLRYFGKNRKGQHKFMHLYAQYGIGIIGYQSYIIEKDQVYILFDKKGTCFYKVPAYKSINV